MSQNHSSSSKTLHLNDPREEHYEGVLDISTHRKKPKNPNVLTHEPIIPDTVSSTELNSPNKPATVTVTLCRPNADLFSSADRTICAILKLCHSLLSKSRLLPVAELLERLFAKLLTQDVISLRAKTLKEHKCLGCQESH